MPKLVARKTGFSLEETFHEGGPVAAKPQRRASAIAVVTNPFAGRHEPDIQWFMEDLKPPGVTMATRLVEMLGGTSKIEGYGKGAMVGEAGELEHAAAILHPKLGAPLRKEVEKGAALVPSSIKMECPGQVLDVTLGHKDAAYVRSHFDRIEVRLNDAPRTNEIMVAVAVTDSGRPLPRVGGLPHQDAEGKDGLR